MTNQAVMSGMAVTPESNGIGARLLSALEAQTVGQKILLSLKDCRTLTGLSNGHLREAIHGGKLKGKIIGRGFKVKRADLDSYVSKL
jgi:excisionase family DNA binding protein